MQLPVGKFKVVDCSSVLIMLIYYLDVTHLLLMKIKAEWFSLRYVGRGQVHVHVCACVCIIKRGSYFTRHTSLLPFIPAIHKTRINVKSVFNAFIFHLFIYLFMLRIDYPSSLLHLFPGDFSSQDLWQNYRRFYIQHFDVSHVLFIFRNYHKNSLNQFDLFVHLIAQWDSNWGITDYWADAIII